MTEELLRVNLWMVITVRYDNKFDSSLHTCVQIQHSELNSFYALNLDGFCNEHLLSITCELHHHMVRLRIGL